MKRNFEVRGLDKINPNGYGGMASREATFSTVRDAASFSNGIECIATTSAPAMIIDWERFEVCREILPMEYMEPPHRGSVPFLDSHRRTSLDLIKGSARDFRTTADQLLCRVFISETEESIKKKISEGHIDSVSIGYQTAKTHTVEIPQGKTVSIDGKIYRNDFTDGLPLLVRTWWRVQELSGVAIGADKDAKLTGTSIPGKAGTDPNSKRKRLLQLARMRLGIPSTDGLSPSAAIRKLLDAKYNAANAGDTARVDAINSEINRLRRESVC